MAQLTFTPSKFVILAGSVYAIGKDANGLAIILQYGGPSNVAYDNCVATVALPWLDLGFPTSRKQAQSIDYVITGAWQFFGSMDYAGVAGGGSLQTINSDTQPSLQSGQIPWSDSGYHVKLQAKTTGSTAATLSSLIYNFGPDEEK